MEKRHFLRGRKLRPQRAHSPLSAHFSDACKTRPVRVHASLVRARAFDCSPSRVRRAPIWASARALDHGMNIWAHIKLAAHSSPAACAYVIVMSVIVSRLLLLFFSPLSSLALSLSDSTELRFKWFCFDPRARARNQIAQSYAQNWRAIHSLLPPPQRLSFGRSSKANCRAL